MTLHPPKPKSAPEDRQISGQPCTRSESSVWILEIENILRRAGGSTETSTTSCGLGMRLITAERFLSLDTATLAAR